MIDCPKCGLGNRPYDTACAHCTTELQDAARAEERRREFDALSAETRAEFEKRYEQAKVERARHAEWRRRAIVTNGILGGLVMPVIAGVIFQDKIWKMALLAIPDAAVGATALVALVMLGGGVPRGLLFLAAAYCVSTGIHTAVQGFLQELSVVWVYGFMAMAAAGMLLGWRTDQDRAEHAIA